MRRGTTTLAALAATAALAACQSDHADPTDRAVGASAPEPATSQADHQPAAEPARERDSAIGGPPDAMQYSCDDGHGVLVIDADNARITFADGREVDITRDAGSSPPMYTGEALQFAVGSQGGTLTRDEVGSFDCRAAS